MGEWGHFARGEVGALWERWVFRGCWPPQGRLTYGNAQSPDVRPVMPHAAATSPPKRSSLGGGPCWAEAKGFLLGSPLGLLHATTERPGHVAHAPGWASRVPPDAGLREGREAARR